MATHRQKLATYAITICTFQQHRHFQHAANANLLLETLFHYRTQGHFLLHAFVVMPDHIHVLITPSRFISTARTIQFVKGGYSHAAREQIPGKVWHSGYFEHRIRDLSDFAAQTAYIAANPSRKHLADYPFVHTQFATQLDPAPPHLTGPHPPDF